MWRPRQRCQSPRERHDTLSDEQRYKVAEPTQKKGTASGRVCLSSLPFHVLLCVSEVAVCARALRSCLVGVVRACVCAVETVKSGRCEVLNIIFSWVSRDCFFASVHQGGKITFYCARLCLCLCGIVKKTRGEDALYTL